MNGFCTYEDADEFVCERPAGHRGAHWFEADGHLLVIGVTES